MGALWSNTPLHYRKHVDTWTPHFNTLHHALIPEINLLNILFLNIAINTSL